MYLFVLQFFVAMKTVVFVVKYCFTYTVRCILEVICDSQKLENQIVCIYGVSVLGQSSLGLV